LYFPSIEKDDSIVGPSSTFKSTKMNIVRLNKGELIMVHSAFRYPLKITFSKASFKKP
jgi:hypothetical protein